MISLSSVRISLMDDSALKSLIDCLDAQRTSLIWHLNGWTWLVAAGVLCEVVFIIWSHRDEFKEWKKALADAAIPFPSRPSRLKLVLEILSVGLVVGGIVGELNFEAKLGDMDNRIQSANNQRVALLRGESDAQRLRAAGLEKRLRSCARTPLRSKTECWICLVHESCPLRNQRRLPKICAI